MKEFVINKKESNQRADKYLMRLMPNATKSFLYKMMRKKNIVLNDHKMQGNEVLQQNDVIKVWFSEETFTAMSMAESSDINVSEYVKAYDTLKNIEVIYEDDDFIILDKPVGVLSQKATNNDISLNEWLIGYLLNNKTISAKELAATKPSISNRLDRNTSGLVLCGKSVYGLNILSKIIKDRTVQKLYHAYVVGIPPKSERLSAYHFKNTETNEVNIISAAQYNDLTDTQKEKFSNIITAYKLVSSSFNDCISKDISLIEVELVTGKTHQIRAHMAHEGYPLVGDNKYGNNLINKKLNVNYQMLNAYRLVFPIDDNIGSLSGKSFTSKIDLSL